MSKCICARQHAQTYLKTGLLKRSQKYELAMLRLFLVIFLLTALKSFTTWGADGHFEMHNMSKSQLDQKLQHKSQMFLKTVFFNLEEKKLQIYLFLNGHFSTISGHFFASYIIIFHKTEVQAVILRCLVCLNYN